MLKKLCAKHAGRVLTIILFFAGSAVAETPRLVNYQGYLMQDGRVVNGTKSMTFSLHDALTGGAQLCTSGAQSVTVTDGMFSYNMGQTGCDLSAINWENPVYLQVAVDGTPMSPREQIAGMTYLLKTKSLDVVFSPSGGVAATNVQAAVQELDAEKLNKAGDTMTGALTVTGDITSSATMTAVYFIGDGSKLTSLNLSASDHNTLSNLTVGDPHTQYTKKAGDTMTGALTVQGNVVSSGNLTAATGTVTAAAGTLTGGLSAATATFTGTATAGAFYTAGNATAAYFIGDGSKLTSLNLSASDHNTLSNLTVGDPHTQYTKKAGDTMTGALAVQGNVVSSGNITAATGTVTAVTGTFSGPLSAATATFTGTATAGAFYTAGNATAAYFIGDGSKLTSLNLSASDHNTLSNLTVGDPHTQYTKKAGDTMTGALTVQGNVVSSGNLTAATGTVTAVTGTFSGPLSAATATFTGNATAGAFYTAGNSTAAYFIGNGQYLTNLNLSASDHNTLSNLTVGDPHTQYTKKAGDTMTGALAVQGNVVSSGNLTVATGTVSAVTGTFTGPLSAATATFTGAATAGAFYTAGNSTAAYFIGDGTYLTNINGSAVNHNSLTNLTAGDPHTQYTKKAGDTMTGVLQVNNNIMSLGNLNIAGNVTAASGTVTAVTGTFSGPLSAASATITGNATATNLIATGFVNAPNYYGNGSNLTGVLGTDSTKVAKAGDTMTGALGLASGGATATVSAYQDGMTDEAGYFKITDSGSAVAALSGITVGTAASSYGVYGKATGGGSGLYGVNLSTGYGVYGMNASTGSGVYGDNSGAGSAIYGNAGSGYGVYGKSGTGVGGYFINNTSTSTLITETGGAGNLIEIRKNGSPKMFVDNTGGVYASGSVKVAGNATAAYYFGDGSNLTNVVGTDSTKVAKVGDAMTGSLSITTNAAGSAFTVNQTGANDMLHLQHSGLDTVVVDNNGTLTLSRFTGNALLQLKATGGNNQSALSYMNPVGATLWLLHNDVAGGGAQTFGIKDQVAGAERFYIDASGNIGIGNTNPGSTLDVAGSVTISGSVTASGYNWTAPVSLTQGTGVPTISSIHTGTGAEAGLFRINNAGGSAPVVTARNNSNLANAVGNTLYFGDHTGATGTLMRLQSSGVDKFVVDKTGVITSGCATGWVSVAGNFCITNASLAPNTWYNASEACRAVDARLCSVGEMHNACRGGGIGFTTFTDYWTQDISTTGNRPSTYGSTSATCALAPTINDFSFVTGGIDYYCCRAK